MDQSTLAPAFHADGTMTAVVAAPVRLLDGAALLALHLPVGLSQSIGAGRYVLARCGAATPAERAEQWQIYLRRPLFFAGRRQMQNTEESDHASDEGADQALADEKSSGEKFDLTKFDSGEFILPAGNDPGYRWLAAQPPGAAVNLIGPLGQGYSVAAQRHNLLLLATPDRAPALLPLIDPLLDRGGRITLVLQTDGKAENPLLPLLPIAVEVRLAKTESEWQRQLQETIAWSDQICAALPMTTFQPLADAIRRHRFRLESGFAQVLVEADLVCGIGACLACVVPTPDGGYTRACVHGPVFDLTAMAR